MKTMRIDTKPISGILLSAFFFELSSVKFFLSPAKIVFFQGFFRSKPVRIGEAMPTPLALLLGDRRSAARLPETGEGHGIGICTD